MANHITKTLFTQQIVLHHPNHKFSGLHSAAMMSNLRLDEIWQTVGVWPADGTFLRIPAIVILSMPSHIDHGIDRRRPTQQFSPRPEKTTTIHVFLNMRQIENSGDNHWGLLNVESTSISPSAKFQKSIWPDNEVTGTSLHHPSFGAGSKLANCSPGTIYTKSYFKFRLWWFLGKTPKAFCPYVMTGLRRRR